ncbi:MAG: hypothetical protein WD035_12105 [Balneolaceae bacterium]
MNRTAAGQTDCMFESGIGSGTGCFCVSAPGDDREEIAAGSLLLSSEGEEIWNRFDLFYNNRDHVDSYRFADLDADGTSELVAAHSEVGAVVYDAETGELLWQTTAEHTQQVETGNFTGLRPQGRSLFPRSWRRFTLSTT